MQNHSQNQTLRAVLAQRQGKGFSEVEATNILRQLLPQIDYLHQQNQAHGQISLNTIIQNNQQIILTATPIPQPANQINIQQDIYALGIVIIELLTGKVASSLRNADGSWNWQDDCFVSDQFADVINRMIGNSTQGRFNYINEIIAVLGLSTPAQSVISVPVNQVVNSQSKNKIAPWKFGLIGVGSTVLVGLAGFGVWNLVSPQFKSNSLNLPNKNIFASQSEEFIYPIVQNKKYGYINNLGKTVIEPQFDYAGLFRDGLGIIGNNTTKKVGFIDKTGKLVIEQKFDVTAFTDSAGLPIFFDNGIARIKIDEKWGYINKSGNIVIKPQFDYVDSRFSDNLVLIQIGDKRGFIDKQGQIVINPQFEDAYGFSEGFASVKIGNKWGFIDKQGQVVISPQFDYAMPFSEGMSCVQIDGKWGFIDKSGKLVISPQFENAFSVNLGITAYLFGIWGFSEGLHPIESNKKWGFIDKTGKYVISLQFDEVDFFVEGLAAVEIGKKWGYIDTQGKYIINPQFDYAEAFRGGIASVVIDNKTGYINKKGELVWQNK